MFEDKTIILSKLESRIVSKDGCWLMSGYKDKKGYNRISHKGRAIIAHRFHLAVKIGRDLLPEECACHTCDNTGCVNPDHLFVGSRYDNAHDAIKKGRFIFNKRKEKCKFGHDLAGENIYAYKYGNYIHHACRKCRAERQKKYKRSI